MCRVRKETGATELCPSVPSPSRRSLPSQDGSRLSASDRGFPLGAPGAFKVEKKMFLILSFDKDVFNVTMKLPDSGKQAVQLPFAKPTGYGLGKSGWVTASFGPKDKVPLELLED